QLAQHEDEYRRKPRGPVHRSHQPARTAFPEAIPNFQVYTESAVGNVCISVEQSLSSNKHRELVPSNSRVRRFG
ncbi:hypothetical protein NHQ30_006343, partial [Ciborinia camelliae]